MSNKKNRYLIYTSNLDSDPSDLRDVLEFAKINCKSYIMNVEMTNILANDVDTGDCIITPRGNKLYVIRAIKTDLESMSEEDRILYEDLIMLGLRKQGISGVSQIIKLQTWARKTMSKFLGTEKIAQSGLSKKQNSMKNFSARIKEMFMPTEVTDVRIAMDGSICVSTSKGYVSIKDDNTLVSYPEELTIEMPVYVICKPKDQLVPGDIIALEKSYAKVLEIKEGKISAISYTGSGKTIYTIQDFLFNQSMVRVVVSLAGNLGGGQINPMMLMAMSNKGGKLSSLLPYMMLSQQGGAIGMNQMLLALMADDGDGDSLKDMMFMSMIAGGQNMNLFGSMFGNTPAPTACDFEDDSAEPEVEQKRAKKRAAKK